MENNRLSIPINIICTITAGITLCLVLTSFCLQILKFRMGYDPGRLLVLFDLSLEQNIPTFWTVMLMILISFLLAIITSLNLRYNMQYSSKWLVLSLGFLYMAYDEGFHVHEALVGMIRPLLGEGRLGIFYYAWVIPGIIVIFLLFIFFFRFLLFLKTRTRVLIILSAFTYLTGCIGMELVGGYYDELYGMRNLTYNIISTLEECFEMAGLTLFIYSLLDYLADQYGELRFTFH